MRKLRFLRSNELLCVFLSEPPRPGFGPRPELTPTSCPASVSVCTEWGQGSDPRVACPPPAPPWPCRTDQSPGLCPFSLTSQWWAMPGSGAPRQPLPQLWGACGHLPLGVAEMMRAAWPALPPPPRHTKSVRIVPKTDPTPARVPRGQGRPPGGGGVGREEEAEEQGQRPSTEARRRLFDTHTPPHSHTQRYIKAQVLSKLPAPSLLQSQGTRLNGPAPRDLAPRGPCWGCSRGVSLPFPWPRLQAQLNPVASQQEPEGGRA